MKINVYYDKDGLSIIDIMSDDFRSFLEGYIAKFLK